MKNSKLTQVSNSFFSLSACAEYLYILNIVLNVSLFFQANYSVLGDGLDEGAPLIRFHSSSKSFTSSFRFQMWFAKVVLFLFVFGSVLIEICSSDHFLFIHLLFLLFYILLPATPLVTVHPSLVGKDLYNCIQILYYDVSELCTKTSYFLLHTHL